MATPIPPTCLLKKYGGNVPQSFGGTIRFSGKEVENYVVQQNGESNSDYQARLAASRYSNVKAHTTLHNGTLIIEHKAIYGNDQLSSSNKTSFNLQKGTLDMNNQGVLNAYNVNFSGTDAIIRTDGSSTINAQNVDMSNGITVDLAYYLSGDSVVDHSGLNIISPTFTLGGMLTIHDTADGFYASDIWSQDQSFTLFTLDWKPLSGSFTGMFDDILSEAYSSNTVDGEDGYQGFWSFEEITEAPSGSRTTTIIAHWTFTGAPIPEPSVTILGLIAMGALGLKRKKA